MWILFLLAYLVVMFGTGVILAGAPKEFKTPTAMFLCSLFWPLFWLYVALMYLMIAFVNICDWVRNESK